MYIGSGSMVDIDSFICTDLIIHSQTKSPSSIFGVSPQLIINKMAGNKKKFFMFYLVKL